MILLKDYIKMQDSSQFRVKMKELDFDKLKDAVEQDPESWASLLISHKYFPKQLYKVFEKDEEQLLDIMIDNDFLPDMNFISSLFEKGTDQLIAKVLSKFHSIPLDQKTLIKLINENKLNSVSELIKNRSEFRKKEIFQLLVKKDIRDRELIKIIFDESNPHLEDVLLEIENDIHNASKDISSYNDIVLSEYIIFSPRERITKIHKYAKELLDRELSLDAIEEFIQFAPKVEVSYSRYSYSARRHGTSRDLTYHFKYEAYPIDWFDDVVMKKVPKNSKFREKFILDHPYDGSISIEEVKCIVLKLENEELYTTQETKKKLYEEFIKKCSIDDLSKLSIEVIDKIFAPAEFGDCFSGDIDKALYFFDKVDLRHKKRLRDHVIPKERIPKSHNARKKSYFLEVIDSLKKGDIKAFREYTNDYGYTLDKFVQDTSQSSKQRLVESFGIGKKMVLKFSYEELTTLFDSEIRWSFYLSSGEYNNEFPYALNAEQAMVIYKKFNEEGLLFYCNKDEQVSFFEQAEFDTWKLESLFRNFRKGIEENPLLAKSWISRAKEIGEISADEDNLPFLQKFLTSSELRSVIDLDSYYRFPFYMGLKDEGGSFVVLREDIVERLTNKNLVEQDSFVEALIERDVDLAKEWVNAYLKGNKHMTQVAGQKVEIRRAKKKMYQSYQEILSKGKDSIIEELLNAGSKYQDFVDNFPNVNSVLLSLPDNTILNIDNCSIEKLRELGDYKNIKFKVSQLKFSYGWNVPDIEDLTYMNIEVKNLKVESINDAARKKLLIALIEYYSIDNINSEELSLSLNSCQMLENTILYNKLNCERYISDCINIEDFSNIDYEIMSMLEDEETADWLLGKGLILSTPLCKSLIRKNIKDINFLKWLESKIGKLEPYFVNKKSLMNYSDELNMEALSFLEERGFTIVEPRKFKQMKIREDLVEQGRNFEPLDISHFSLGEKTEILEFIENKVDERYKELELKSFNIDSLDTIQNYNVMKTMTSLNEEDIVNILNIPKNIKSNKKIIKGIVEMMTLNSGNIIYKIYLIKQIFEDIGCKDILVLADFLDYANPKDVKESEGFSKINLPMMQLFEKKAVEIREQGMLLNKKNKKQVLRFLRSCQDENTVEDTLTMISDIIKGRTKQEEILSDLLKEGNEFRVEKIRESILTLTARLEEVTVMDDVVHMHDRLVPLMKFIKEDPTQPIGQDKFGNFERKDLEAELGNNLFFPKTRGEVQYLGETYGWCVTGAGHYTRGVMNDGNVLVGICEKGTESAKENVIALGHFTNKGSDTFRLEQLRWAKQKKGGSRNISATSDFKYSKIIAQIEDYLVEYKKKRKKNED